MYAPPRRQVPLRRLGALLLFLALLLGPGQGQVAAATESFCVTITTIDPQDDPEDTNLYGDYAATVQIGDNDPETVAIVEDSVHSEPFGTDIGLVTPGATVPITIWLFDQRVYDYEDYPDQQIDLSPSPLRETVELSYNTTNGTWTGLDIAPNQSYSQGVFQLASPRATAKIGFAFGCDLDDDGLYESWEQHGVDADLDGTIDLPLPTWGANPRHKDLFLELDHMAGNEPSASGLQGVKHAFAVAPANAGPSYNPDRLPGINLRIDSGPVYDPDYLGEDPGSVLLGSCSDGTDNGGDGLADAADPDCRRGDNLGGGSLIDTQRTCRLDSGFYAAKTANFDPLRRWVFRYAIQALYDVTLPGCDEDADGEADNSGRGELCGNDFVIFDDDGGSTLIHELGHNLCLDHGGTEDHNCKPNYISVMNYDHASGIRQVDGNMLLDYSPPRITADGSRRASVLPTLRENALNETTILDPNDNVNQIIFVDATGKKRRAPVNQPINWNGDIDPPRETALPPINIDTEGKSGTMPDCVNTSNNDELRGHDDWLRISLPFRNFGESKDGPVNPVLVPEPTAAQRAALEAEITTADPTTLTRVRGDATYGDTTATLTATLGRTGGGPLAGATVAFTLNGQAVCGVNGKPACPTTNAQGVATLAGAPLPAGQAAGSYAGTVGASFAGTNILEATTGSGPLVVARRVLWVKPTDRTVGLRQPNPPTTPPTGCVLQQTPTSACWLELANGSRFVNGDDWADLNLSALRFQYNRNPPATNASEYVGKTYKITAFGAASGNYDIRYLQGTLTVIAP